jgi:N-acyl-D-aspartate/D-glutamate deacylase
MHDLKIVGGTMVDGTGSERYRAGVGVKDRQIVEVRRRGPDDPVHPARMAYDLPAARRRLVQDSSGYAATIVSGILTRPDGADTGARPGRLVRGAR